MKSPYIEEVVVSGIDDEKSGDTIVTAEIFPSYNNINDEIGEVSEDGLRDFIKKAVDEANEQMPLYKRVKRFSLREEEFEKTTTKKIKRNYK